MIRRTVAFVAVLILQGVHVSQGQAPPPAQRASGASPAQVSAILVDVVVRDRRGNPVRDLTPEDFELYEDNVRQTLGSMTPVFRDAAPQLAARPSTAPAVQPSGSAAATTPARGAENPAPAGTPAPAGAAENAPDVIALVFDRLSADARTLAHTAAHKYLGDMQVSQNYMAVFGIDLTLMPYQTFTRDAALIRQAIDKFAQHSSSQYGSYREARREAEGQQTAAANAMAGMEAATAAGGPGAGAAAAQMGAAAAAAQFAQMTSSMTQTFEALERDQAGYATSNALMSVVNGMRAIPGRKSIVFFSEGLSIPPNVQEQFLAVIDAANRANVSIYPMDAMGLRAESSISQTRDEMMDAAKANLRRNPTRDTTGSAMMAALERNEDLLRMDPHSGLGQLAEDTGGFLIANTNDLRGGFERIENDMRNYYLLTYVPSNENFDGKFRQIEVKVKKPGLSVHSRKGYFAFREPVGLPMKTFEAPALVALDKTPVPNAFPVRASVLRFPEADRPHLLSVVVELATAGVLFKPAEDKTTYTSEFTVLVRFRDEANRVVDKMSERYQLNGPLEQMDRAKLGTVIFYRQPELPPGVYTMEAVVYDAVADKASVRFVTVEQPTPDPTQLRLSSLMLVSRGEKVPQDEESRANPLTVGDMLLYPNMGTPLQKGSDNELAFFFTAYPGQNATAPLSATVELLHDAKVLARAPLEMGTPDAAGRVQQVSRLPIAALPPGRYQLRIQVQQGSTTIGRSTEFRIVS